MITSLSPAGRPAGASNAAKSAGSALIRPLTGIRGLAAVWVVVFHAYPLIGPLFDWPERGRVPVVREGFLAVDLFFVLSGFLLSVAYSDRFRLNFRSSLAAFAVARVHRIFPLHWVTLSLMVSLVAVSSHTWWGPGPFSPKAFALSAALVQNWSAATALAWNHPTWSLSAEWAAYLLFPPIAYGLSLLPNGTVAIGGSVLSLMILDGLILHSGSVSLDHVGPAGMVRCFCEFLAGALAWKAVSFGGWNSRILGNALTGLGYGLLAFALAVPGGQLLAPFAFVALVIGCAQPCDGANRIFGNPVSLFLGEISFSIYLVHIIVLGCMAMAVDRLHLGNSPLIVRAIATLTFPILVVAVAYVTWKFIEKPFQSVGRTGRCGMPRTLRT